MGPRSTFPLSLLQLCILGGPHVGYICSSIVAGLTTVGMPIGSRPLTWLAVKLCLVQTCGPAGGAGHLM